MTKMVNSWRIVTLLFVASLSAYSQTAWTPGNSETTADLKDVFACQWCAQDRLFVVGDSGKALYSDDRGLSWHFINSNYSVSFNAICFSTSDTGVIVGENGEIFRIIKANDEYQIIRVDNLYKPGNLGLNNLNDVTTSGWGSYSFYCVGDSGKILRSTNRGYSWFNFPPFSLVATKLRSIAFHNYYEIFIAGDSGTLLKTPRANVWEKINPPEEDSVTNFYSVNFIDDTGWVTGSNGTILYSLSGGSFWTSQNSGVDVTLRGGFFTKAWNRPWGMGWVVGDSGVILKTTDKGLHWTRIESGTTRNLNKIYFTDSLVGIVIGDSGTILRTATGGSSFPSFEALPPVLSMGQVVVNSTKRGNIIVVNNAVVPVEISSVFSDLSYFVVTPSSMVIPPFGNFVFDVIFTPDHYGNFSGDITFTSNAQGSPHVVAVSGMGVSTHTSGWSWQNPIPQGNSLYDIEHIGGNKILCVGEVGTIIKSMDGGISWASKNYAGGTANDLNKLCFVNEEVGFAVGKYGSVIKTVDGGEHWETLEIGSAQDLRGVAFADEQNGFIVGGDLINTSNYGTIYSTTDGGITWSLQFADPRIILTDVDALDPLTAIAVGVSSYYPDVILQTTDGGITWKSRFSLPYGGFTAVKFIDDNTAISVGNCIARSEDRGLSWVVVDDNYYLNDLSFVDNLKGIAVGYSGRVLTTYDGGLTWSNPPVFSSVDYRSVDWLDYTNAFSISGVYWSDITSVKKTSDEGISWNIIVPEGAKSTLRSVSFSDAMNGIAAGDSGKILTTSDGGKTWIQRLAGTAIEVAELPFKSVKAINTSEFTVVGNAGVIIYTSDCGNSWQSQTTGTISNLNSIFYYDSNLGWMVGSGGAILATTNRGADWRIQTGTNTNDLFSVSFASSEIGIAVGAQGTILRTTNGGIDWISLMGGTSSDLFNVAMHNDSGYAVGESGVVLQTTDIGKTWNQLALNTGVNLYSVNMTSSDWITIAGEKGMILQTTDGGKTWNSQESGTGHDLFAMHFINADTGTIVGEGGTILHTMTGGVVSVKDNGKGIDGIPKEFVLHQNYPNPFNSETKISFMLPRQEKVNIKIYDIMGREVATLTNGIMQPGTYHISWNAADMASGVYLYRMQAGAFTSMNKMLLIK